MLTDEQIDTLSTLPPDARRKRVQELLGLTRDQLRNRESVLALERTKLLTLKSLLAWAESDVRLERNDVTRLHRLKEAMVAGRIYSLKDGGFKAVEDAFDLYRNAHTFLVQHDWNAALGEEARPTSDELRLPFPISAFEFRLSGRNVIVIGAQKDGDPAVFAPFIEVDDYWIAVEEHARDMPAFQYAWHQVAAISVALDAEVATHNVVRAPHALNAKRAKQGKALIADFHVIDLARRYRAGPASAAGAGSRKRLHFRRGHWRHYETHKTWIRWTLVGDPSLGFINAEYRL